MQKRVEELGQTFNEIYAVEYPRLSWYIHSGLAGFANLQQESFERYFIRASLMKSSSFPAPGCTTLNPAVHRI